MVLVVAKFMKSVVTCTLFLLLGVIVGWQFEHSKAKREKTTTVQQMIGSEESLENASVARDVLAIGLIDSGRTQAAIESLSVPIANFLVENESYDGEDPLRTKVRTLIETLIATNKTVARVVQERHEISKSK